MTEKFGHVETPILPDSKTWEKVVHDEWEKVVKKLDAENRKKEASREKKKTMEEKAKLITAEATMNNPKRLTEALAKRSVMKNQEQEDDDQKESDDELEEDNQENQMR